MNLAELAPDEPLSPELVLVLPAELRARAIAALGDPTWPTPRPKPTELRVVAPRPTAPEQAYLVLTDGPPETTSPPARTLEPLARFVGMRILQLGLIFVAVTVVTVAMTLVAQAVR